MSKVVDLLKSPYLAPLTEPVKRIAAMTSAPAKYLLIPLLKKGKCTDDAGNFSIGITIEQFFEGMANGEFSQMDSILGVISGAIGGGFLAHSLLASVSTAPMVLGCAAGVIIGAPVGILAGPFVFTAAITAAALFVGCVLQPIPGFIAGVQKALRHHRSLSPLPAPAAPAPAPQQPAATPAAPAINTNKIVEDFSVMPQEQQEQLLTALRKEFNDAHPADISPYTTRELPFKPLRPRSAQGTKA